MNSLLKRSKKKEKKIQIWEGGEREEYKERLLKMKGRKTENGRVHRTEEIHILSSIKFPSKTAARLTRKGKGKRRNRFFNSFSSLNFWTNYPFNPLRHFIHLLDLTSLSCSLHLLNQVCVSMFCSSLLLSGSNFCVVMRLNAGDECDSSFFFPNLIRCEYCWEVADSTL